MPVNHVDYARYQAHASFAGFDFKAGPVQNSYVNVAAPLHALPCRGHGYDLARYKQGGPIGKSCSLGNAQNKGKKGVLEVVENILGSFGNVEFTCSCSCLFLLISHSLIT